MQIPVRARGMSRPDTLNRTALEYIPGIFDTGKKSKHNIIKLWFQKAIPFGITLQEGQSKEIKI